MKSAAFEVYRRGRWVTTVYFDADMSADEVYRSLVEHDGYSPAITVRRR